MKSQQIILAGIGMGSGDVITEEVRQLIEEADCLIGAERMITSAQKIRSMNGLSMRQCERNNRNEGVFIKEYRTEEIVSYIKEHKEHSKIGILLSGDTGFYSGAKNLRNQLLEKLSLVEEKKIKILPGISSLSYLASKVGVSWEDAKILSLHGKDMNFVQTIHRHSKTFLLLGGKDTGRHFYESLLEYGLGDVQVHVGCQMSYEEEKILSGKLYEMKAEDFEGLCAVLVENPSYCKAAGMHLKDEEFLRGKVPMTKSEVRSVSIAELELTEDAIVYDIGAGTGSVSIEIARAGEQIRVYAIEKNPEGVKLIDQNRKKFRTDGVRIIEGLAPQALEELETPTHAFVGGSSGNLREIVQLLQRKNPDVRIVINAISLETVSEVMGLVDEGVLPDVAENQGNDGDHQHESACLADEMHRQRAVIVLSKPQHEQHHPCVPGRDDDDHPPRDDPGDAQCEDAADDQQAVGDGIEDLPDLAHLIEGARDDAVEAVGDGRNGEDDQCGHHPVIGDQPCDKGDGRDSQDADEVRHGEVGREFLDRLHDLAPHDRRLGAVILELLAQFPRRVERVVLDSDGTETQDRVERDDVLRAGRHAGATAAALIRPNLHCHFSSSLSSEDTSLF